MKVKSFFSQLDHEQMVAAIAAAERHTSGEIRVYVSHHHVTDPMRAAIAHFHKLGMHRTLHRNAVLIFVAPESQNFFIVGDEAIHGKCGIASWEKIATEMQAQFRTGKFTGAILHGIESAGKLLAEHFPRDKQKLNELPDNIVEE